MYTLQGYFWKNSWCDQLPTLFGQDSGPNPSYVLFLDFLGFPFLCSPFRNWPWKFIMTSQLNICKNIQLPQPPNGSSPRNTILYASPNLLEYFTTCVIIYSRLWNQQNNKSFKIRFLWHIVTQSASPCTAFPGHAMPCHTMSHHVKAR